MEKLIKASKGAVGSAVKLSSRYNELKTKRSGYLSRAKEYAKMTLPYVAPENNGDDNRAGAANQHGFNGLGAQATNHLANRIVHNMFPAHQPFFNLEFTEEEKAQLVSQGYEPNELVGLLNSSVKRVHDYEGMTDGRVVMVSVIKHLIITGNVCLFIPPKGENIQALPLSSYCVSRDSADSVIEIMTEKKRAFSTVEVKYQDMLRAANPTKRYTNEDEVTIHIWAVRVSKGKFLIVQTMDDILVIKSKEIKEADLPWIPLRWNTCHGEDYGRGLVEDQASDFNILEFLSQARMKGMVMMSDVKYLVKAGAVTDIDELATSPTGEFLVGSLDEIGVLQLEKYADFTPISNAIQEYERRIGQVFLMQSAVRRDAERVTAYELRLDAQELNESLGGIYSHLASTLQKPYAYILLTRTGFPLKRNQVKPRILTGMEALAKSGDLEKLRLFTETMGMTQSWPQEILARTDMYLLAKTVAESLSMDLVYIRDDEAQAEVSQAQNQQAQQNMLAQEASKAAPDVINKVADQAMQGGQ